MISNEELTQIPQGNAYDAIQRLRPRWLQSRGVSSMRTSTPEFAQVYLDNAPMGGLGALRQISVGDIRQIRYLDSRDATTRYGTGHGGGAILVSTRTGGG